MYALVDCNNFYCSCERLFQPQLEGKPVIVLSNNDGCAIARSEEAKALGIDMGTPAFIIKKLIAEHNVAVFSSNYTLYGDMSERVMKTLAGFAPALEIYSIDEAFLDLTSLKYSDLLQLGESINQTIKKNIGIPVTVGIAPTKVLAKMANRYAKKNGLKKGVFMAGSPELAEEMMRSTKVGDIWGVGHQYALLLKRNGFHTAFDLLSAPEEWMRQNMTVVGQRILNELRGISCITWEPEVKAKKNICTSRSFGILMTDKFEIREALCNFAATVALKLRAQSSCTSRLQVFVQTNPHKTAEDQYLRSVIVNLQTPTNLTAEIIKHACRGLDVVYRPNTKYMKCGLTAMDLVPDTMVQTNLFEQDDRLKDRVMTAAMDRINQSMGKDLVRMAVQGYEKRYRPKLAFRSPRYTTNIRELLKVRI